MSVCNQGRGGNVNRLFAVLFRCEKVCNRLTHHRTVTPPRADEADECVAVAVAYALYADPSAIMALLQLSLAMPALYGLLVAL